MQHKIINTGDYLLIVDDTEIKYNDWYYSYLSETIGQAAPNALGNPNLKKVICHLPLNNSPILEGVDLLPLLEDQHKDQLLKAVLYSTNRETVMSTLNNMVKIPVGFECEMVHETWGIEGIFSKTKTITNSQGFTQWVGEYIY